MTKRPTVALLLVVIGLVAGARAQTGGDCNRELRRDVAVAGHG